MSRKRSGELLAGAVFVLALREGWSQIPEETRQLVCSMMVCIGPVGAGIFFAIVNNVNWMRSK